MHVLGPMFSTSVTPLPNLQSCRLMIRLLKNNNANKGKKKRVGRGGGACWTLCKQNSKVTFIGHSFRYWVVSVVFFSVGGCTDLVIFSSLRKPKSLIRFFFSVVCVAEPTFFIFAYGYIHRYIHTCGFSSLTCTTSGYVRCAVVQRLYPSLGFVFASGQTNGRD